MTSTAEAKFFSPPPPPLPLPSLTPPSLTPPPPPLRQTSLTPLVALSPRIGGDGGCRRRLFYARRRPVGGRRLAIRSAVARVRSPSTLVSGDRGRSARRRVAHLLAATPKVRTRDGGNRRARARARALASRPSAPAPAPPRFVVVVFFFVHNRRSPSEVVICALIVL